MHMNLPSTLMDSTALVSAVADASLLLIFLFSLLLFLLSLLILLLLLLYVSPIESGDTEHRISTKFVAMEVNNIGSVSGEENVPIK